MRNEMCESFVIGKVNMRFHGERIIKDTFSTVMKSFCYLIDIV